MKKINSQTLKYLLLIVAILTLGIGVAYAALSATLNITFGNVTQNALSWNIGFQGSSATGTFSGTSSTGSSCGTATITSSSVSVAATSLSKPGDKCTYTLTVKNSGTVGGKLNTITPTAPSGVTCSPISGGSMTCGNITYRLLSSTSGSGTVLTTGGTLNPSASSTIYLVVEFTGSNVVGTAVEQSGAKFELYYVQA
ncbi:MAG: hypothetical protein IKE63_03500 [Bacilli bacterium]|nr:hypothetical protein [Bacilli bacterium]